MTKPRSESATSGARAQYRPLTSRAHSRRSSKTTNRTSSGNGPTSEEVHKPRPHHAQSSQHDPSAARLFYTPPEDPEAAKGMGAILAYLKEKGVVSNMEEYIQLLLETDDLPYNPYPILAERAILQAEKYHMMSEDDVSVKSKIQRPVQATTLDLLWGLQGCTCVWGLKNVVQVVNPAHVMNIQRLLEANGQSGQLVTENGSYTGQVLTSVIGPLSLMGDSDTRPLGVNLRLEYLIYGEDVEEGLDIFAFNVLADVEEENKDTTSQQLLYVSCTSESKEENSTEMSWTGDRIKNKRDDFKETIIQSTREKGIIRAEVIFQNADLSGSRAGLVRGSKEYMLHFIEVSPQEGNERLVSFGRFPYQTLVDGVFLKKADAEAYLSAMKRHPVNPGGGGLPKKLSRKMTSKSGAQMMMNSGGSGSSKTKVEGLSEVIKTSLRVHFLKMIQGTSEVPDCFTILHAALILILLDRSKYQLEELTSIYRFLQSTGAKFYIASQLNNTIIDFIQAVGMNNTSHSTLMAIFKEYKRDILRSLDPSLHGRPQHQMAYHSYFCFFMGELEALLAKDGSPSSKQVIRKCLEFEMFCNTVQYQLTEAALANMEQFSIKKFLSDCEAKLTSAHQGNGSKTKSPSPTKSDTSVSTQGDQRLLLKHGVEPPEILQQKHKYIPVNDAIETSNHPAIMAKEGIIMQYLLDVRLDDVWAGYLRELISSDHLPPNSHPRLVTALRGAAYRMRLCGNRDDRLTASLTSLKPKLADVVMGLYTLPESGVYGYNSALYLADQEKLKRALQLTDAISDVEVISQRGKFQISSGISLTGRTVFYGRMAPYVLELDAHHHFYIKGPLGSNTEALQLFSKLVSDDISGLKRSSHNFVVEGLYAGGQEAVPVDQLLDPVDVSAAILDAASRKMAIYIKLYHAVGWRYIPIVKHYRLHFLFVDNADDRHEAYYPEHPADESQYMFLSVEEATEFIQKCSKPQSEAVMEVKRRSLEEQCLEHLKEHRVLPAYESYLAKCLMNNDTGSLADIWRVFHSPAGQVEYLIELCASLSDLVLVSLKAEEMEEALTPSPSLHETRGKPKKGNPQPVEPLKSPVKGKVNQRILFKMAIAFRDKVEDTLSEPTLFAPACLNSVIGAKIQDVLDVERSRVIIDHKSIICLEEIQHLLKPLLVASSSEVDSISLAPLLKGEG